MSSLSGNVHFSNMLRFNSINFMVGSKCVSFQFIFNLMACGKGNANKPIEDFITHSPAPVDMAAKMSAIYTELSFKVSN